MLQNRESKGGTTDEAFHEQCYRGREELLLVQTLTFLIFPIFHIQNSDEKGKKLKRFRITAKWVSFRLIGIKFKVLSCSFHLHNLAADLQICDQEFYLPILYML